LTEQQIFVLSPEDGNRTNFQNITGFKDKQKITSCVTSSSSETFELLLDSFFFCCSVQNGNNARRSYFVCKLMNKIITSTLAVIFY
jgi:hypothetical protein